MALVIKSSAARIILSHPHSLFLSLFLTDRHTNTHTHTHTHPSMNADDAESDTIPQHLPAEARASMQQNGSTRNIEGRNPHTTLRYQRGQDRQKLTPHTHTHTQTYSVTHTH